MLGWALLLLASSPPDAGTCRPLRTETLSALAAKVEAELDREQRIQRLVELASYWDTLCPTERTNASSAAVRSVTRLFRLGPPRWLIIEMLFDVRPNLRAAEPELGPAIRDEQRIDAYYLSRTRPLMPTNYGVTVDELRCLRHKARTGRTDAPECRALVAIKAAEAAER